MPPSLEIHVPASPTRRFADMLCFLAASLARNGAFDGDWQLVVTLGHDGDLHPGAPEFGWAHDYPVVFRRPDAALWAQYDALARARRNPALRYHATILAQFAQAPQADLVLYLDADTVLLRPIGDLLEQVARMGVMAAKPAWQPPVNIDLDAVLAAAGLTPEGPGMVYSGHGWSFLAPRTGPPYFNGGIIACPRAIAATMHDALPRDFDFVTRHFPGHYSWQVAHCLTLIRHRIPWLALDERWNMGIGEPGAPLMTGPEGAALEALAQEQLADARLLHYCTPTRHFRRNDVMGDAPALRAFLDARDLDPGEAMLQGALRPLCPVWEAACRAAGR